jgi:hypothetical protein
MKIGIVLLTLATAGVIALSFVVPGEPLAMAAMGVTGLFVLGAWALTLGYVLTVQVPRIIAALPPETQGNPWISWLTYGAVVLGSVFLLRMLLRAVRIRVPTL